MVVRSVGMIEPLRPALLQAGVPVAVNPTDVVLAEQRIVAAMLYELVAQECCPALKLRVANFYNIVPIVLQGGF